MAERVLCCKASSTARFSGTGSATDEIADSRHTPTTNLRKHRPTPMRLIIASPWEQGSQKRRRDIAEPCRLSIAKARELTERKSVVQTANTSEGPGIFAVRLATDHWPRTTATTPTDSPD